MDWETISGWVDEKMLVLLVLNNTESRPSSIAKIRKFIESKGREKEKESYASSPLNLLQLLMNSLLTLPYATDALQIL